jgi:alpha-glucosidase
MPWAADAPNLGFSSGTPWLPAGDKHRGLAVDRQEHDPASTLAFARQGLALRKAHPALRQGRLELVEAGAQLLVVDRSDGGETLRCTFNLSGNAARSRRSGKELLATGDSAEDELGPYAALIEELG